MRISQSHVPAQIAAAAHMAATAAATAAATSTHDGVGSRGGGEGRRGCGLLDAYVVGDAGNGEEGGGGKEEGGGSGRAGRVKGGGSGQRREVVDGMQDLERARDVHVSVGRGADAGAMCVCEVHSVSGLLVCGWKSGLVRVIDCLQATCVSASALCVVVQWECVRTCESTIMWS